MMASVRRVAPISNEKRRRVQDCGCAWMVGLSFLSQAFASKPVHLRLGADPMPRQHLRSDYYFPAAPFFRPYAPAANVYPGTAIWFDMGWRKASFTLHAMCRDCRGPGAVDA